MSSDGGILYYRKDLVPDPAKTWDEMMEMCSIAKENNIGCYSGQFKQYEGLTVNASEAINSSGGSVLDKDGKPSLNTPEAEAGLENLVEAFKNGNIPQEAITYQEEESRRAFQDGKLLFLRNWPYVYNLATTEGSSKVKDVLGMAALPGKDGPGASSLGGHSAAISVYSENKATALDFVKFLIEEEQQKFFATQGSLAPVLGALYEDQELVAKLPYLPVLKTSIENAVPRPVTPFYPAVTQAIQENAYAASRARSLRSRLCPTCRSPSSPLAQDRSLSHGNRIGPDAGQKAGVGRHPESTTRPRVWGRTTSDPEPGQMGFLAARLPTIIALARRHRLPDHQRHRDVLPEGRRAGSRHRAVHRAAAPRVFRTT